MKSDLDRLMAERGFQALIIAGPDGLTSANAPWNYMVNGQHLTGTVIKRRDQPAQLLFNAMERQQAEASGLELLPESCWDRRAIMQAYPDRLAGTTEWYRQIFTDLSITGRVGWYGTEEASVLLPLIASLRKALPQIEIVGEFDQSILAVARRTKDAHEIERIADVGRRTCAVVQAVVDFIGQQHNHDDIVVDGAGAPVTIGDVKALIRRELDRQGLEAPEGTIFAQGHDAAIPHATGDLPAPLRLGQSIAFDIFPRDPDTGYYHDMTRTFAIGYAPPELAAIYDDVLSTFEAVTAALKVGERIQCYHELACQTFAARGHRTVADEWPLEEGYIHSLSHGLGLDVHEVPYTSVFIDRGETLEPGTVFTIEPGLYYPSQSIGVRIEDTYVCNGDGHFRSLTPFPYNLVIPLMSTKD